VGLIYSSSLQTLLRLLFNLSKLYEKRSSTGPASRVRPCPRMFSLSIFISFLYFFFYFHSFYLFLFYILFTLLLYIFLNLYVTCTIFLPCFFFVPLCLHSFRTFAIFHRRFPPWYDLIILWYYLIKKFQTYLWLDSPRRAWITGSWPNYDVHVWPLAFPR